MQLINTNASIENFITLYKFPLEPKELVKSNYLINRISKLGIFFQTQVIGLFEFIDFFGVIFIKSISLPFNLNKIRWSDFPELFIRNGIMALPITLLIVFLIGLISGYQGALQLKQFGADIFIADLVGISITRELSPLMVAILIAGRSGSSFAAQLGTMRVTEEIDALDTMGFDRYNFLVMPRILSVALSIPILVLICNIVGILGGLIAAMFTLDITLIGYFNRLQDALSIGDVVSGLIKSWFFGYLVAMIGCFKGLSVSGGADSVGKLTTSSVVAGVFVIILIDAIFTFLLNTLGI